MFAAAKSNYEMELFRMALRLFVEQQVVPDNLKEYFNKIINQAKKLVDKPDQFSSDMLPEAIDLALGIKSVKSIEIDASGISNFDSLTPEKATHFLQSLEISLCS
ncbi:MAG: hypothetical protein MUO63_13005 [Desulfobulbaceae bacterium]|nr:hypothetical protein [Desulfobulbaceae bacterium]